jgi:hypothetical protein
MAKKLLEAMLPVPKQAGTVIEARLPLGTKVLKFGFKAEKSKIAAPGPNGTPVTITPLVLCLGDPTEKRHETHRFQMVMGSEDIPDDARYVDLISLPDGATIHLFELGEATPFLQLVGEPSPPAA